MFMPTQIDVGVGATSSVAVIGRYGGAFSTRRFSCRLVESHRHLVRLRTAFAGDQQIFVTLDAGEREGGCRSTMG